MADETLRRRTIYFHGGDRDGAKFLARPEVNGGKRGITRDARVFVDGEVETCDRIVLLPSVRDWDLARIVNTYERAGIQIEHLFDPKTEPALESDAPVAAPVNEELRRLSNKQLRDLAVERGIDISNARERASIIAAIDAAAQKGAHTS